MNKPENGPAPSPAEGVWRLTPHVGGAIIKSRLSPPGKFPIEIEGGGYPDTLGRWENLKAGYRWKAVFLIAFIDTTVSRCYLLALLDQAQAVFLEN